MRIRAIAVSLVVTTALAAVSVPAGNARKGKARAKARTFKGVHVVALDHHRSAVSYGDFKFSGPKVKTLHPLPEGIRYVAASADGEQLFGLGNHEVYPVDLKQKQRIELALGDSVPELSWPCGITYDTKRDRLLVASLGGVGYLYAYHPSTEKWLLVADMDNLDVGAIGYDAKADCIYAIYQGYGGGDGPTLLKLNAKGAVFKAIKLWAPQLSKRLGRGPSSGHVQLVPLADRLVIISSPGRFGRGQDDNGKSRIYLVDTKTGKTNLRAEY